MQWSADGGPEPAQTLAFYRDAYVWFSFGKPAAPAAGLTAESRKDFRHNDMEAWRRRSEDNPRRIGGSKWARELAAFKLLYGWAVAVGHIDRSPVLTHTVRRRDGTVVEARTTGPRMCGRRT